MRVQQVSCSYYYSTFLTTDGEVYVCGYSDHGGLGFGAEPKSCESIAKVDTLTTIITAICCGEGHTLAIDEEGMLWSWGRNNYGQLGHGHKQDNKEFPKAIKYFMDNEIQITQVL